MSDRRPTARSLRSIRAAKAKLGVDCLMLQIHNASFPSDPDEDCGRGSPYSRGADRLFRFAQQLGFDGIQLGPRGKTPRGCASPYDGALFSLNPLDLPLARMVERGLVRAETFAAIRESVQGASDPPPQTRLDDAYQRAVEDIVSRASADDRAAARRFLASNQTWLVPDALYDALCTEHQADWWGHWGRTTAGEFDQRLFNPRPGEESAANERLAELREKFRQQIENYALIQWLLAEEHQALRRRLDQLGLLLYADMQVGQSPQDSWARASLFLVDYRLGAPPSRTNLAGQPWGYSVFDPAKFGTLEQPGPVLQFVRQRLDKTLEECDGVRIDHPHGWIDPWVYRADDPDPFHAVQNGARLFSSPAEPLHPQLRAWSIARADQIDTAAPAYSDHRIRELDASQIARYAIQIDSVVASLAAHGCSRTAIACEVLSTQPYQIGCVLSRRNLGRFRVTQKLKLADPTDVYRVENAEPEDWIMLGTHDTPSIWELAPSWVGSSSAAEWGRYLATLLAREDRDGFAMRVANSASELIHGLFASLLASRARHASLFFPDLFGMSDRYNLPGVVADSNWRLRLPSNFEQLYETRIARGEALDLGRCFDLAVDAS